MVLTIFFSVLGVYTERALMLSVSGDKSVLTVRAREGRAVFPRPVDISETWASTVLLEVEVDGVCVLPEVGDGAGFPSGGVSEVQGAM